MPTPRAKVWWLTGLSGAGKSTIAEGVVARLRDQKMRVVQLDGDALRAGLCSDLGFCPEDRLENVRRVAEIAKLMAAQDQFVVCSLISPLVLHRELARKIVGEPFVEVYVRCSLDECIRRDPKGLYAKALSGSLKGFTGIDAPYEPPEHPVIVLDTQSLRVDDCVARLLDSVVLS